MKKLTSPRAIIAIRAGIAAALIIFALIVFQVLATVGPTVPTVNPEEQHPRVNVFTAAPVHVQRQWKGYGTVEAIDSANVPARVTATVTHIPERILEGVEVDNGEELVRLDDTDFVNQVAIAEKNLAGVEAQLAELDVTEASLTDRLDVETRDVKLAEDELDRIRKMFEANAANQKDLDAAERAVLAAERNRLNVDEALTALGPKRDQLAAQRAGLEASLKIARENLDRCTIRSPIAGVIQHVDVEVGENLTLGQRVARVVNLQRVQAPLSLPAKARSYVKVSDRVRLTSTADPGLAWIGDVTRIAPEDDPQTRTFHTYVEVPRDGQMHPLAPGVFVAGTVTDAGNDTRLVVPRRSIRTGRVMLIREGMIYSSEVTEAFAYEGAIDELGLPDEQWAVIVSGIAEGDMVVLNPTRSLSDGQHVTPVLVNGSAGVITRGPDTDNSESDASGGATP